MYPKSFPTSTPVFPWNGNETQTTTVLSPLPAPSPFTTPIEKADNEQKWMQQRRDLRDQLGVQQWLQLRQDQISEQEQLRMRKHGVGSTVLESSIPWNSQQMQPVQYMLPKQPTVNPLMHAEITALMTQYLQQKQTDVVSEAMKVKDSKELLSPVDIYEQKRGK
eukprot:PhF_6_TR24827/c1_g1_i6/m.34230